MKKKGWIATCILTVVAIFYVSPLFVVLMNSFKKKAFINLEPFCRETGYLRNAG